MPQPLGPEERRARIAHYALRKLMFTDPEAWAKRIRRQRRLVGPQTPRVRELPELDAYDQRRLWSHIRRGPPEVCWPWQGATGTKSYGRFKVDGRLYLPHRLVYSVTKGPILNAHEYHGSVVMHSCDNPLCCNPKHLVLGRQVNNVEDMVFKGRHGSTKRPASLPACSQEA